jgi:hypothetical protein
VTLRADPLIRKPKEARLAIAYSLIEKRAEIEADRNLPATRLLPLMALTGDHRPLVFLAGALGYELIPHQRVGKRSAKDLGDLADVYGRAVQVLTRMYDEGRIDADGLNAVRALLREATGHKVQADKVYAGQHEFDFPTPNQGDMP